MHKGPNKHSVFPGDTFKLESDQAVTMFGLIKGQREHIFAIPTTARRGVVVIPALVTQVEVKTPKSTNYTVVITPSNDGREYLDDTPIELGLDANRPPSLHEEMRRFITEEVSRQAESTGHSSFEEEDDFTDDEENFITPYTLTEMQDEAPLEEQPPSEPKVDSPPDEALTVAPENPADPSAAPPPE